MILTEKKNARIDSGLETRNFSLQASGKAFEILSSGLYNNREKAVLRELSCNAYDAHVAAGKQNIPFDIVLPTRIEPTLIVKDYGTGLSENDIYELYTTYFNSDKTDSNLFVGALGLGSKSPFSITDQFTVESRYKGTKSIYLCSISQEGIPQVSKVLEQETSEENGITVKIAIPEDNVHKFQREVESVVKPFSVLPNIQNHFDPQILNLYKNVDKIQEGKGWFWLKDYNKKDSISVIQGNVEYPLNLPDILEDHDKINFFYDLIGMDDKIVINFPLGTLNVAANREDLSLDKRTISNIKKRLEVVMEDIINVFKNQVNNIDNELDLASFCLKFNHEVRLFIKDHIYWKGELIRNAININVPEEYREQIVLYYSSGEKRTSRETKVYTMNLEQNIKFFYYDYDKKNKGISKIKNKIYNREFEFGVLVYDESFFTEAFKGDIAYRKLSEVENPYTGSRNSKELKVPEFTAFYSFIYTFLGKNKIMYRDTFYNLANNTNKKIICVVSGGKNLGYVNGKKINDHMIRAFISSTFNKYPNIYKKNFLPIIYKVKKAEANRDEFTTNPNIVNIEDIMNTLVNKYFYIEAYKDLLERLVYRIEDFELIHGIKRESLNITEDMNSMSPLLRLLNIYKKIDEKRKKYKRSRDTRVFFQEIQTIGKAIGVNNNNKIHEVRKNLKTHYIDELIKKVTNYYPMLKYIRSYMFNGVAAREVIEYIKMVDFQKNSQKNIDIV